MMIEVLKGIWSESAESTRIRAKMKEDLIVTYRQIMKTYKQSHKGIQAIL